jgi:CubicO group peptidase (beta-lactamase class C family)
MKRVAVGAILIALVQSSAVAWAELLPAAQPEQVGLSSERLERIAHWLKADIDNGQIPGAVVLVARKGRVAYFESFGFRDKASAAPMPKDAIFRIYSMTKPITSVAVMILVEEGKVVLTDPLSKFLPLLKALEVSVQRSDPNTGKVVYSTVPAEREITVQDLLRHTSGFTYAFSTSNVPVKDAYTKGALFQPDSPHAYRDLTPAEEVERLAKVPLAYQPGTRWEYGLSTDVLGRVVEAVSGMTLGQYCQGRIFAPLKMTDSGFWVPKEKVGRIAEPFRTDPTTGKPVDLIDVAAPPKNDSGGGGGVSTTMDYARFCQMLLSGGRLDDARILSRTTVSLMASDHLGPVVEAGPPPSQRILGTPGYTFGLGFAVRLGAGLAGVPGSAGDYTWAGAAGTYFWIDPKEELVGVLMTQDNGPIRIQNRKLFRQLVYQAIVD